jgi:hypothetical protein
VDEISNPAQSPRGGCQMVRGIQTGILISSRRRRVVFFSGLQLPERAKGRARRKRSRAAQKAQTARLCSRRLRQHTCSSKGRRR